MADKKISQLTGATTPLTGTEELAIVQGGSTVKATAQDIADLAGPPVLPVLNTYPVTTPASAGTQFLYKGNIWRYMTQAEIDSAGWTAIVTVGFPAPLNLVFTPEIIANTIPSPSSSSPQIQGTTNNPFSATTVIDFVGFGVLVYSVKYANFSGNPDVTTYRNAQLLTNIRNIGTTDAFRASNQQLSAAAINDLFTQLPPTVQTATIRVTGNPGAATCNPTIATSKGYLVVT